MMVQKYCLGHVVLRSVLTDLTVLESLCTFLYGPLCLAPGLRNADIQKHDTTVMDKRLKIDAKKSPGLPKSIQGLLCCCTVCGGSG